MNAASLLFGPDGWGVLLLQGAAITAALSLCTIPAGFGGGLLLAVLKQSARGPVRAVCNGYTTFFRGIPDLLSLFIVYFGLQALLNMLGRRMGLPDGIELSGFLAGVIALSAVVAAYSSEVWVAALRAVPHGQTEAARSLGLRPRQVFRRVLAPQLVRIALPGLGNIWSILVKDTSLISTLAVSDLLRVASEASKGSGRPLLFYGAAAGMYLVISILSEFGQSWLERRSNRGYA